MSRQAWVASGYLAGPGSESFVREERSLVRLFYEQHESVSRNRVRAGRFDIASIEPHTRTSTSVQQAQQTLCTTAHGAHHNRRAHTPRAMQSLTLIPLGRVT